MSKTIQRALSILLFGGLGIIIIFYLINNLSEPDKQAILNSFKSLNYFYVIIALIFSLLSHIFRAARWRLLLNASNYNASITHTTLAVGLAYFANLAIPRLGEFSRCVYLQRKYQIPVDVSLGTVVIERIIDVISISIIAVGVITWQYQILVNVISKSLGIISFNIYYFIFIAFVATIFFLIWKFKERINNFSFVKKIKSKISGFYGGLMGIKKLKSSYLFLFYTLAIWLCYILTVLVMFKSIKETIDLGISAASAVIVFGTFAFALVQGGIGAYQLIVMETLIIYGIDKNVGFAIGWISWTSQTLLIIVLGLIAVVVMGINKPKSNQIIKSEL